MSREGRLARNTIILSVGTFLPKLASFITLPILTGCLTKTEYGTYDLITVLVSLLLPTVTFQIQAAAFRFLIDCRDNETEIQTIVTNIIAFIIPTSVTALVILFFALGSLSASIRIFTCLYFFADIFVNAARQIARGLDRKFAYSLSAIFSALGKMVFAVICVYWLKAGLLGTVISLFMASMISLLYLVVKARLFSYVRIEALNGIRMKEMLAYSWPMVPNSISAWIMRLSDRLVVTAVLGVSANAVYAVANKLPGLLNIAQNTFTMAWQENATVVSRDKDADEYYSSMFSTMYRLMAGFFGLLIAATPLLFQLLVRGDYEEAYYQMPILFLAAFFFSMSTFLGGIYVAYMRSKSVGITTTIAALVNLITDISTIRWIGLYAASGSTLIAYVFLFVYRIIDVQKIVRVRVNWTESVIIMSAMIMEGILCFIRSPILNIINPCIAIAIFFAINQTFVKVIIKKTRRILKGKS